MSQDVKFWYIKTNICIHQRYDTCDTHVHINKDTILIYIYICYLHLLSIYILHAYSISILYTYTKYILYIYTYSRYETYIYLRPGVDDES